MKNLAGFTLIEMIITIVVMAILVLGISSFIELGAKGYVDTVARQRIQIQAQFLLEKLSRELRSAVPNSIATTNSETCISFYPTQKAGFYAINPQKKQLNFLVGNPPQDYRSLSAIINPSRQEDFAGPQSIAIDLSQASLTVLPCQNDVSDTACNTVNVSNFSPAQLKGRSVANRIYLFNHKVSYCLNTTQGIMTRMQDDISPVTVAENIAMGSFTYASPTLQRGGLVRITLTFSQLGEQSFYQKEVQILNVP